MNVFIVIVYMSDWGFGGAWGTGPNIFVFCYLHLFVYMSTCANTQMEMSCGECVYVGIFNVNQK